MSSSPDWQNLADAANDLYHRLCRDNPSPEIVPGAVTEGLWPVQMIKPEATWQQTGITFAFSTTPMRLGLRPSDSMIHVSVYGSDSRLVSDGRESLAATASVREISDLGFALYVRLIQPSRHLNPPNGL